MTAKLSTRALVIGTGFGGAVAACRLSQAGFAPLVLERGRRYEAGDFPALPPDSGFLPDGRRLAWGPDQGLVDVQDLDEIVSVQAAGYGGGSLLYANVHLRAPSAIFEQKLRGARVWPKEYTRDRLDPYYDLAASMLDVAPITEHADGAKLVKVDQLKRASRALGREDELFHPPLAVSRGPTERPHQKRQSACVHCGACCMGCPHRAKNTLDFNYLAIAEAHGAVIKTQAEALAIEGRDGGYRVCFRDHLRAENVLVDAEFVFLCAGSVHTTRLLASANLGLDEQQRAPIGLGYFPNADAFGVIFDAKHPQYPSWGPTITTATVFHDRDIDDKMREPARSWFMLQDGGYARDLERMIGLLRSPLLARRNHFPKPAPGDSLAGSAGESPDAPPESPSEQRAPPLRSPLDGMLEAWAAGSLGRGMPDQLAAALPGIREAVSQVIMPAIVGDTIERGVRRKLRGFLRWFPPDSPVGRAALSLGRRLAGLLGTDADLARDAQASLEALGGLPPAEIAACLLGYESAAADHRMMLLGMGPDMTSGVLHVADGKVTADLDLYHLAPRYLDEELAMRNVARVLGGELRVNPAWSFLGKPITVHSQGGCGLGDADAPGALDENGEVMSSPGLYVLDGASLRTSVGSNPSATILAIAERNVLQFIRRHGNADWPNQDPSSGAALYRAQQQEAARWAERARARGWALEPPAAPPKKEYLSKPLGIAFDERMQGFHLDLSGESKAVREAIEHEHDETYRRLETRARPERRLEVKLTPRIENLNRFLHDRDHRMQIRGAILVCLPGDDELRRFDVEGSLSLFRERRKRTALTDPRRIAAQKKIAGSYVNKSAHAVAPVNERQMRYDLEFVDHRGRPFLLRGYKRIRQDPGLDAWRDTTALFVRLESGGTTLSAGVIHIDQPGFLKQLRSVRVVSDESAEPVPVDPARVAWTLATFTKFFFGHLQQIYLPEANTALDALFRPPQKASEP